MIAGGIALTVVLVYASGLAAFCLTVKPFVNMYGVQRPYQYELAFEHRYTEADFAGMGVGHALCLAVFRHAIIIGAELGIIPSDRISA